MNLITNSCTFFLQAAVNRAQKRWRRAFAVIYSIRAFRSTNLRRTRSYMILNVDDGPNDNRNHDLLHKLSLIPPAKLANLAKDRSHDSLADLGGVDGLLASLSSNADVGVRADEEETRREAFGTNAYASPPAKGFLYFAVDAMKDTMLVVLVVSAVLSLGFGIKEHGVKEGWYDGASIVLAVLLVVAVTAVSNFRQDRRFKKLSEEAGNVRVGVVRDGRRQEVSVFDVVVGDVVFLRIGDQVPADGVLVDGHSLEVDESSMTGETELVRVDLRDNPFLSSGTKIGDGYGRMVVTAVGMNTTWGQMMSTISHDNHDPTPLQERLQKLTSSIGKIGTFVAVAVLVVLIARYFSGNTPDESGHPKFNKRTANLDNVMSALVRIVSDAVTIIVVAIPEGLPLAVTLTLAYSMRRMMADKAMVRKLPACETMGSVTTICTDKTGTLTLNLMKVVEFFVGQKQVLKADDVGNDVVGLLSIGAGMNTTGSVYKSNATAEVEITGSPTEKAILSWAVEQLRMDVNELKRAYAVVQVEAFNSQKKRSGVIIRSSEVGESGSLDVHWKGAAEMILGMCSHCHNTNGGLEIIDESKRIGLEKVIEGMAAKSLRCIAFAHKHDVVESGGEEGVLRMPEEDLTLVGIVGIKDPCRPEVRGAVKACWNAGVRVKMVTGDNVFTAKAIAVESGILREEEREMEGVVVEGKTFREWSEEVRMEMVGRIRVMARSSPFDKLLMVQCLKRKGEVVAVTGDGTNDAPALKEADVGLSMGIQGTEVAKECSDIVILDDNFASVVTVVRWGRCVYTNIQKFIQFQLTVNIAALTVNLVAAFTSGSMPLTTVQMLWVNLIMDTLGALALATERPTKDLMSNPPIARAAPLITPVMWRNLLAQAAFQVGVLLAVEFKGQVVFGVDRKTKDTVVFNAFVFCQLFNEFNSRRLERRNVFEGLAGSKLFVGIVGVTAVMQVAMVELLRKFAGTERLGLGLWGVCLGIGFLSWPIGWIVKCIPVGGVKEGRFIKVFKR